MENEIGATPDPAAADPQAFDGPSGEPARRLHAHPVVRLAVALLAVALILVLLGSLFSPRYWRF